MDRVRPNVGLGPLACGSGHPICKVKSLKPWQGHVHQKTCGLCDELIPRHDFRWRCEHHCDWDLCGDCYDKHWRLVIGNAKQALEASPPDRSKGKALLEAVPEERTQGIDFMKVKRLLDQLDRQAQRRPREDLAENGVEKEVELAVPDSVPQRAQGAATKGSDPRLAEVVFCLLVRMTASIIVMLSLREITTRQAFPHPLLANAAVLAGGAALLGLAKYLCDRASPEDGASAGVPVSPPPRLGRGGRFPHVQAPPAAGSVSEELKAAVCLGLMYAIETTIGAKVLCNYTFAVRNAACMLAPVFMVIAGLLGMENGREHLAVLFGRGTGAAAPFRGIFHACGLASLGSLLMAWGGLDSLGSWFTAFIWALLEGAIFTMKWVFLQNVFPAGEVKAYRFTLKVAVAMLTTAAPCCFEMSAAFDWSSYYAVWFLPNKGEVALVVLGGACGAAALLIAELRLLPLTSPPFLGLPSPFCGAAAALLAALWSGGGALPPLPPSWWGGGVVYLIALGLYKRIRGSEAAQVEAGLLAAQRDPLRTAAASPAKRSHYMPLGPGPVPRSSLGMVYATGRGNYLPREGAYAPL